MTQVEWGRKAAAVAEPC